MSDYNPDPAASVTLGNIINLLPDATAIPHQFVSRLACVCRLPGGQLYFDGDLQLDTDGWPGGRDNTDPSWQPGTSLEAGGAALDANRVPYIVLPYPHGPLAPTGVNLGDIAAVVHKATVAFAVCGDHGDAEKLGEGSLKLFRQLGEERLGPGDRIINSGMGPDVITVVFPGSRNNAALASEAALLAFLASKGPQLFRALTG